MYMDNIELRRILGLEGYQEALETTADFIESVEDGWDEWKRLLDD